ncbi:MAG: DNA mismatch repair endonuclease MutL [Lachnospiraceae bacterium]|nr:DNA mismatch repair endonuclease MutL [Lachnospiraceae bacterium]
MSTIRLLDQATVNKIAAGEVVERPASVVKELVENAIDAGATKITVEIREGGIGLIRITDNGAGISPDQVRTAFLRHATSKIRKVEDLQEVLSLGFRGEALASIAAVSRVDMITRTNADDTGIRYVIEGGIERVSQETACGPGTTIRVEDLFYNTPPRRKFLKKPASEAAAVTDLMQKMILGHPEISFTYLNGKAEPTLFSSGKGDVKSSIYAIYGRETLDKMIPVEAGVPMGDGTVMGLRGYISRPQSMRANRSYETMFINGRYVRSALLERALDEAYKDLAVPGTFPIAVLHLDMDPACLDVNVHPTKMEVRFTQENAVRTGFYDAIVSALRQTDLIARSGSFCAMTGWIRDRAVEEDSEETKHLSGNDYTGSKGPMKTSRGAVGQDMGEEKGIDAFLPASRSSSPYKKESVSGTPYLQGAKGTPVLREEAAPMPKGAERTTDYSDPWKDRTILPGPERSLESLIEEEPEAAAPAGKKEALKPIRWEDHRKPAEEEKPASALADECSSQEAKKSAEPKNPVDVYAQPGPVAAPYEGEQVDTLLPEKAEGEEADKGPRSLKLIGQVFRTYWIAEERDVLYLVDQHAAHERVLYDKYRAMLNEGSIGTQELLEPMVLTVDPRAVACLEDYQPVLEKLGYRVEAFGEDAVIVRGVPFLFRGPLAPEDMGLVMDMLYNGQMDTARDLLIDRIATMSCKAAVKGNDAMSFQEAEELLTQLFASNNPYNCPHGRPTIISMTKYDLEKRFLRV